MHKQRAGERSRSGQSIHREPNHAGHGCIYHYITITTQTRYGSPLHRKTVGLCQGKEEHKFILEFVFGFASVQVFPYPRSPSQCL